MEPKKIKKLVLKQETIANLSVNEQTRIKGGGSEDGVMCAVLSVGTWINAKPCPYGGRDENDGGGGGNYGGNTTYLNSIPLIECPYQSPLQSGNTGCFSIPINSCFC